MPSNKQRLYVALFARGGPDPNKYHWGLIVGPKNLKRDEGALYHAKQKMTEPGDWLWVRENLTVASYRNAMLLGLVVIGKLTDRTRVEGTLATIPVVQNDAAWTCRVWVKDAVAALEASTGLLGTRMLEWDLIEKHARDYLGQKRLQRRFDGSGSWPIETVPTFDLLQGKEIVP